MFAPIVSFHCVAASLLRDDVCFCRDVFYVYQLNKLELINKKEFRNTLQAILRKIM